MKSKPNLPKLLELVTLTHKFSEIKRSILHNGKDTYENDAEHSFQLALIAWYLVDIHGLKLNKTKVLMYAIAHDLVETYAGDVDFYDIAGRKKKKENEEKAFKRICKEFPNFTSLHSIIKKYEAKKDNESKFVWALDKLLPPINIYLDNGRNWKKDGITLEKLHSMKIEMVAVSATINDYYYDLYKILKKSKNLFPK